MHTHKWLHPLRSIGRIGANNEGRHWTQFTHEESAGVLTVRDNRQVLLYRCWPNSRGRQAHKTGRKQYVIGTAVARTAAMCPEPGAKPTFKRSGERVGERPSVAGYCPMQSTERAPLPSFGSPRRHRPPSKFNGHSLPRGRLPLVSSRPFQTAVDRRGKPTSATTWASASENVEGTARALGSRSPALKTDAKVAL